MGTRQTGRGAVDDERLAYYGRVLGRPGDVVAFYARGAEVLGVEDVGVAQGGRGVDVVDCDRGWVASVQCPYWKKCELTVDPLVDRMRGRVGGVRVRVFPPELDGVLQVYHHDIRSGAGTPRVAAYTGVSVLVRPRSLKCPVQVTVSPAKLLKRLIVARIPHVHADLLEILYRCVRVVAIRW